MAFLLLYLGSLAGRVAIRLRVWRDPSLHTLMCFFLPGLALLEIAHSTGLVPPTLASTLPTGSTPISLPGCGSQMCFFILPGGLTVSCWLPGLRTGTWPRVTPVLLPRAESAAPQADAFGFSRAGVPAGVAFDQLDLPLLFCGHNEIYHFRDTPAVTRPACADTRGRQATHCVLAGVGCGSPLPPGPLPDPDPPLPPGPLPDRILAAVLGWSRPGRARGLPACASASRWPSRSRLLTYPRPSASCSPGDGRRGLLPMLFSPRLKPWI